MRIAFLGKGGSGKTTLCAAYCRWLEQNNKIVLAVDADVNMHLQRSLDLPGEAVLLGAKLDELSSYVRGTRLDLGNRPILSTTPPSRDSQFIKCSKNDPLLQRYILERGSLMFLKIGAFSDADVGANCYHTKLHSLCVLLNHLRDSPNETVVVDATAGVDTLSTSLVVSYDLNIFVIEPTIKSVQVYIDYLSTDPDSKDRTMVILNKVLTDEDRSFVHQHIAEDKIIASIPFSNALRSFEQGDHRGFEEYIDENIDNWIKIDTVLLNKPQNRTSQNERLYEIHKKNCEWWYNSYYGEDLSTGIDVVAEEAN